MVMVALRPMCDAIGLDYLRQLQKLKAKSWATVSLMPTVGADGKPREMLMIDRRTMTMWLTTPAVTSQFASASSLVDRPGNASQRWPKRRCRGPGAARPRHTPGSRDATPSDRTSRRPRPAPSIRTFPGRIHASQEKFRWTNELDVDYARARRYRAGYAESPQS